MGSEISVDIPPPELSSLTSIMQGGKFFFFLPFFFSLIHIFAIASLSLSPSCLLYSSTLWVSFHRFFLGVVVVVVAVVAMGIQFETVQ